MLMCVNLFSVASLFFNYPATTDIYTLSLHDALPISDAGQPDIQQHQIHVVSIEDRERGFAGRCSEDSVFTLQNRDRKSTRLNSSHRCISYAVFCLKKKRSMDSCADSCTTDAVTMQIR